MLNSTKINDVLSKFGSQFMQGKEDPVIHFYETFLAEYNPKKELIEACSILPNLSLTS